MNSGNLPLREQRAKPKTIDSHGKRYTYTIRADLFNRQRACLLWSGVLVYFLVVVFQIWSRLLTCWGYLTPDACLGGSILSPSMSYNTLIAVGSIYLLGVLPVLFLRKWYRNTSVRLEVEENFWGDIRTFLKTPRTFATLLVYGLSSINIAWSFYRHLNQVTLDIPLHLFLHPHDDVKCSLFQEHACQNPSRILNEYFLILLVNNGAFGVWYALDYLIRERYLLYFPEMKISLFPPINRDWRFFLLTIWEEPYDILIRSTSWLLGNFSLPLDLLMVPTSFSMIYWIFHLFAWKTAHSLIVFTFKLLSIPVYNWLYDQLFDVQLFNRTIICSLFTLTCWTLSHRLFEHFFTRVIFSSSTNEVLVNGLNAKNSPYIQGLAYLELWHIAKDPRHLIRRTSIYHEYDKNSWINISRACIEIILGLGHSANAQIQAIRKKNELIKEWHKDLSKEQKGEKNKKEEGRFIQLKDFNTVGLTPRDPEYWDFIWFKRFDQNGFLYKWIVFPLLNRTIERRATNLLRDKHLVVLATEALASLTKDSLKLDSYGVVQPDISKIFECFLDCLLALEEYAKNPPLYEWDSRTPSKAHLRALAEILEIVDVLKEAIYSMTDDFYNHMDYVRLPTLHFNRFERLILERF